MTADTVTSPFRESYIECQVAYYIYLRKSNANNMGQFRQIIVSLIGEDSTTEIDQANPTPITEVCK